MWPSQAGERPFCASNRGFGGFHEGVVGIVASRLKDRLHRPTFVFAASGAPGRGHELKGSGRSIAGFHLRDALDLVAKRHPGVLLRFGGHAMAADERFRKSGERILRMIMAPGLFENPYLCLLYTSPSPRDRTRSRMPSSA